MQIQALVCPDGSPSSGYRHFFQFLLKEIDGSLQARHDACTSALENPKLFIPGARCKHWSEISRVCPRLICLKSLHAKNIIIGSIHLHTDRLRHSEKVASLTGHFYGRHLVETPAELRKCIGNVVRC